MMAACLLGVGLTSPALAAGTAEAPPAPAPEPRLEPATALRLFADVEDAWATSDAERLASLVDTSVVRIAVKPGAPLTAALTRVAAAFLLQDQLRLVRTQGFQVTRFQFDPKRRLCRGTATWTGDWGGRQGKRAVRVALVAKPTNNRWFLTEIRAED